jgi:hypothetical protein
MPAPPCSVLRTTLSGIARRRVAAGLGPLLTPTLQVPQASEDPDASVLLCDVESCKDIANNVV